MTEFEAEYDDLDEFVFGNYPRLTDKLLNLSVADDYEEAKKEWRVTGKVWRQAIQRNGFQPRNQYILNHPSVILTSVYVVILLFITLKLKTH